MSKKEIVCSLLEESVVLLNNALTSEDPQVIRELSAIATETLSSTYRPMLEAYYADEFCKEAYCDGRDFRDTALTYLSCVEKTLTDNSFRLRDAQDFLLEALCWTEKAQSTLCFDCEVQSDCDQGCDDKPQNNCCDSCDDTCDGCEDGCNDTCEDGCDDTCGDSCDFDSCSSSYC
jgi:hypothetical protein